MLNICKNDLNASPKSFCPANQLGLNCILSTSNTELYIYSNFKLVMMQPIVGNQMLLSNYS